MFEEYLIYFQSPWIRDIGAILLVVILTVIAASLVNRILKIIFDKVTALEAKRNKEAVLDRTKFTVTRRLMVALVYILGFVVIIFTIPQLKAFSYSALAGAGVLAVIIGFAMQKTLANVMAGIFIAMYEPIRIGDKVLMEKEYGTVSDITLRHTVIITWENKSLIIPNAKVDDMSIINYTINDEKIMKPLELGISYDSDIDKARKIMQQEIMKHPDFRDVHQEYDLLSKDDKVKVRVIECGDFAINLRAYFWAKDQPTAFKMGCDLLESIKKRFDKEGIEIPFPYRTIVYKKDLSKPKKIRSKKKK